MLVMIHDYDTRQAPDSEKFKPFPRGNHLSNAPCLTHVFFKSGAECN